MLRFLKSTKMDKSDSGKPDSGKSDNSNLEKGVKGDNLDPAAVVNLLLRAAGMGKSEKVMNDAENITSRLEYMPLAIERAGTFMKAMKVPISEYLENYYEKTFEAVEERISAAASGGKYGEGPTRAVVTTWEISFDAIQKEYIEAADLLQMFSFLDHRDICEELFYAYEDSEAKLRIKSQFDQLVSFSFAKYTSSGGITIDAVEHSWARERMQESEKLTVIQKLAGFMAKSLESPQIDRVKKEWDHVLEKRVSAHASEYARHLEEQVFRKDDPDESTQQQRAQLKEDSALASVMYRMVGIFRDLQLARFDEGQKWLMRALAGQEKSLGAEDPATIQTASEISANFFHQGLFQESLDWHGRVLTRFEKILGDNTSTPNDTTASDNFTQGQYDEALKLLKSALARFEAKGKERELILEVLNNIACVFKELGRYEEAQGWFEVALAEREETLGKEHTSTLTTVHNMAYIFYYQGRFEEAAAWGQRALTGREISLGKEHPMTLGAYNNVGLVLCAQGRKDEALELFRRALAGLQKTLGTESQHPYVLTSMNNVAMVLREQCHYAEARELYERVLAGCRKILGGEHVLTLSAMGNMAMILRDQKEYDKALELLHLALAGQEQKLGKEHMSVLGTVNSMACVFRDQKHYDQAMECYGRILAIQEKVPSFGKRPELYTTMNNMAVIFREQGRYDEALEWYQRALAGYEKVLGENHPSALNTVHNMSYAFQAQKRYEEALECSKRALAGFEKTFGAEHPSTKRASANMRDLESTLKGKTCVIS